MNEGDGLLHWCSCQNAILEWSGARTGLPTPAKQRLLRIEDNLPGPQWSRDVKLAFLSLGKNAPKKSILAANRRVKRNRGDQIMWRMVLCDCAAHECGICPVREFQSVQIVAGNRTASHPSVIKPRKRLMPFIPQRPGKLGFESGDEFLRADALAFVVGPYFPQDLHKRFIGGRFEPTWS